MKPHTILHILTLLLLALTTLLLLLVTLSAPVINHFGLLRIRLFNSSKVNDYTLVFGSFGYCTLNAYGPSHPACTHSHVGYSPSKLMHRIDNPNDPSNTLPGKAADGLTRLMVLHPIVTVLTFLALLLSLLSLLSIRRTGKHPVLASLAALALTLLAWILTLIVMATDFTVFGTVKREVNKDKTTESEAVWGGAIWMVVASFLMLSAAVVLEAISVLTGWREKKRADDAEKAARVREGVEGRRKKRFGIF